MSDTKRYGELFGRGMLFHGDGDCMFRDFEQCSVRFMSNEADLPKGNLTLDDLKVYFRAGAELTIGFHSIGPEALTLLLGASTTASQGLHAVEDEYHLVPATPFQLSLTNSTVATVGTTAVLSVYEIDASGNRVYFDQGAAAADGVFSISGQQLTFHSADEGVKTYSSYMYADTSGTRVNWDPDDHPVKFTFLSVVNWLSDTGDPTAQFGMKLLNVIPKPDFELGATRAGHNPITLTCAINNDAVGDCCFYFDA